MRGQLFDFRVPGVTRMEKGEGGMCLVILSAVCMS